MARPRGSPTRRDRIVLLLGSYLDALTTDYSVSDVAAPPESRILEPSILYRQGSYHELGRALDLLRGRAPKVHWHTWRVYVEKVPYTDGNGRGPAGRHLGSRKADLGLTFIDRRMPATILAPVSLLEQSGFTLSAAARLRDAA